ncbi:MAG TPA: hypothetical protein VF624_14425 [Tepidisphaeraceae bacterium]
MPVTQRWVHGGLVLAMAILSLSLTVLILGGTRRGVSDAGLPGSAAIPFYLPDSAGKLLSVDHKIGRVTVLVFADRDRNDVTAHAPGIREISGLFAGDGTIDLIGVNYTAVGSLLGPSNEKQSDLARECPQLRVVHDLDGSVSRAYRISGPPVVIVVGPDGVIRGRIDLRRQDAVPTASEIINNLRGTPLPVAPMVGTLPH